MPLQRPPLSLLGCIVRKGIIDVLLLGMFLSVASYAQVGGPGTVVVGGGGAAPDLSAYVLIAGDEDGQTIQGFTGADKARIDIGVTDVSGVRLIGTGATPGFIYAYTDGVFASSPDLGTSFELYDGGIDIASDGSSSFYGATATNIGVAGGPTSINGSRVNVASFQTPPTNANDACIAGDTIDTATFHYYCAATDTWVRVAMATW